MQYEILQFSVINTLFSTYFFTNFYQLFLLINLINLIKKKIISAVFDSYGKFPSGLLRGNLIEQGDFDECLSIHQSKLFNPQYCLGLISKPEFGSQPAFLEQKQEMARAVQQIPEAILNTRMVPGSTSM